MLLLALLACAGCDQVFGLSGRVPPPGPDAGPKPSPTCLGAGDRVELPLLADTYITSGDTSPRGSAAFAEVSPDSSLLVRFDRGDVQFRVLEMQLSLADSAVGCAGGNDCSACGLGTTGMMSVYLVRPDWDEATATHAERMTGVSWSGPGATGTDRSVRLTQTSYSGTDLSTSAFFMDSQLGAGWPAGLSFVVGVETAGAAKFGTQEGASSCGMARPPTVFVTCTGASSCGNDMLEAPEQCDDGNTIGGDDCSPACRLEECGNGVLDVGEECDDGNVRSGDGCSALCLCDDGVC